MKKIFSFLLMADMLLAVGASVTSCSGEDDDGTISERRVENYVAGYKWYLDNNERSEYRFYRNRLVTCMSSGKVTSGSLTYAESNFFGTWGVADGKLVTTFTAGAYEGFDWNDILYGSLAINKIQKEYHEIETTAPNGDAHTLSSYGMYNDFVDYTDASDHDGALIGTWWTTAYASDGTAANFTMTVGKKGKVRFTAPKIDIDNTTTCTTKKRSCCFRLVPHAGNWLTLVYLRKREEQNSVLQRK